MTAEDQERTPTNLGDYEIPGWSGWQMWSAAILSGLGFACFCLLVWIWTR